MIIDFGDLKKIVKENIVDKFDHALVLNSRSPWKNLEESDEMFNKVIFVDFAEILSGKLPSTVKLHSLLLRETATSYAEWFTDDNPVIF